MAAAPSGIRGWHSIFFEPFAVLLRHRRMLFRTSLADVRARIAASALGWIWIGLYPLLFLGAYALVYLYVFQVRFPAYGGRDYVVLIFCGLVPFLWFSESLAVGTGSVVANGNLIKNTLFPIELVPAKSVLAAQATFAVGIVMVVGALAATGKLSAWVTLLPLLWFFQFLLTVGVVWATSSLCVFVRDLQQIIGVCLLLLMMVSPIAFPAEAVPENLRGWMGLNPLYYLITCYQDVLINGRQPANLLPLGIISFAAFFVGHAIFSRLKGVFADYV
ncbi:MAG: ABC transporter permease [Planctomycetes bacterium]|nr:ABC transporter permease [Planctomycetota bacterium]